MNTRFRRNNREANGAIAYLDILRCFRPDLPGPNHSASVRRRFKTSRCMGSLGRAEWPTPPCSPGPPPRGPDSERSRVTSTACPAPNVSEGAAIGRLALATPGDSLPNWGGEGLRAPPVDTRGASAAKLEPIGVSSPSSTSQSTSSTASSSTPLCRPPLSWPAPTMTPLPSGGARCSERMRFPCGMQSKIYLSAVRKVSTKERKGNMYERHS
jgi:hypothetical protein